MKSPFDESWRYKSTDLGFSSFGAVCSACSMDEWNEVYQFSFVSYRQDDNTWSKITKADIDSERRRAVADLTAKHKAHAEESKCGGEVIIQEPFC